LVIADQTVHAYVFEAAWLRFAAPRSWVKLPYQVQQGFTNWPVVVFLVDVQAGEEITVAAVDIERAISQALRELGSRQAHWQIVACDATQARALAALGTTPVHGCGRA
jgi:hypothetical protein